MFLPWIGENWGQEGNMIGGVRLMVLGESHYCSPDKPELIGQCDPGTTRYVVEEWAIRKPHRFFTGITQIISGRPKWEMSAAEVLDLWNAIAFYNYVPVFVADRPRSRPTGAMFEAGHEPFAKILSEFEPEAIIVCGKDLWWWIMKQLPGGFAANPPSAEFCSIGSASAARIMHPSAQAFSSTKTRPTVERLMTEVRATGP